MLAIYKVLPNADKICRWLENDIRSELTPDVSSYARGRLRTWLGREPSLKAPFETKQATQLSPAIYKRFIDLIEWNFDFCLVTYSGDEIPIGIAPHMDAGYADFEARSLHLSGECLFTYWQARPAFGKSPVEVPYHLNRDTKVITLDGHSARPTHTIELPVGAVTRFNCKNPHAASPGVKRWNINFWRAK